MGNKLTGKEKINMLKECIKKGTIVPKQEFIPENINYSIYPGWSYEMPIMNSASQPVSDQRKYKTGENVRDKLSHAAGEIIGYKEDMKLYMVKHDADWLGTGLYREDEIETVHKTNHWSPKCECGSDSVREFNGHHSTYCPKYMKG